MQPVAHLFGDTRLLSAVRPESLVQSHYRAPSSTEVKAVSETKLGRRGPDMGQPIAALATHMSPKFRSRDASQA